MRASGQTAHAARYRPIPGPDCRGRGWARLKDISCPTSTQRKYQLHQNHSDNTSAGGKACAHCNNADKTYESRLEKSHYHTPTTREVDFNLDKRESEHLVASSPVPRQQRLPGLQTLHSM